MARKLTLRGKALIVLTAPVYLVWYLWLFACATIVPMGGFGGNTWVFAAWAITIVGVVAHARLKGGV